MPPNRPKHYTKPCAPVLLSIDRKDYGVFVTSDLLRNIDGILTVTVYDHEDQTDPAELEAIFTGENYQENYKILVKHVRERGAAVPPLVNAYMSLSPTLRSFGTALNPGFGSVEETGMLLTMSDMFEEKAQRHMTYDKNEVPMHLKK